MTRVPKVDLDWKDDLAATASASVNERGIVTLRNVRDWTYNGAKVVSTEWRSVTLDPKQVKAVWFILEPFPKWHAVGHTLLSFEFEDGSAYAFSIEARLQKGQTYSSWKGLFNTYELAYTWGTERDFISRRLYYLGHDVRAYPLAVSSTTAQILFSKLITETNELAAKPRFYNTLTENCTNTLAYMVNELKPHTLPRALAWYFTGLSDIYLMKHHFIALINDSVAETQAHFDLTPLKTKLESASETTGPDFSRALREALGELYYTYAH